MSEFNISRHLGDPKTGKTTTVAARQAYTNEIRAQTVAYWQTPSILDPRTDKLRKPTLDEAEQATGIPKSNVQRWAAEMDKINEGRPNARKNWIRKGKAAEKALLCPLTESEVVSALEV
jgi:hypothetical protein